MRIPTFRRRALQRLSSDREHHRIGGPGERQDNQTVAKRYIDPFESLDSIQLASPPFSLSLSSGLEEVVVCLI